MNNSFVSTDENSPENSFKEEIPKHVQLESVGKMFIHENKGQIKDLYKISSSIGQGKRSNLII